MLVAISWQRQIRHTHATRYDGVQRPVPRTEQFAKHKYPNMCAQYSGRKKSENEIVVHFRLKVDFIGAKRNYSGLIEYIIISVRSRLSKNESHSRRPCRL